MNKQAYLCLLCATFLWGLQPIMMKILLHDYSTITIIMIRCILMVICYFFVIYIKKCTLILPNLHQLKILVLMGFCGTPLNNITQFEGLHYTTAFHCTLFGAIVPVLTAIMAYFILKECLNGLQWLGIFLSLGGVIFMLTHGDINMLLTEGFNIGDVLIFISEIGWALYIIFSRQIMSEINPLQTTAWASLIGMIFICPYALLSGQLNSIDMIITPEVSSIGAMLYVTVFGGVLAMIVWNTGVKKIGASKSAIFSNITPFTGLIFGNLILDEKFSIYEVIGMIAVGIGVYMLVQLRYEIHT